MLHHFDFSRALNASSLQFFLSVKCFIAVTFEKVIGLTDVNFLGKIIAATA
jgi:hypothetical protein